MDYDIIVSNRLITPKAIVNETYTRYSFKEFVNRATSTEGLTIDRYLYIDNEILQTYPDIEEFLENYKDYEVINVFTDKECISEITFKDFYYLFNSAVIKGHFTDTVRNCPMILCNDGFIFSAQAGIGRKSTPNINSDVYSHFEIEHLNFYDPNLEEYRENTEYINTSGITEQKTVVYSQVPVEDIEWVVKDHGGIEPKYAIRLEMALANNEDIFSCSKVYIKNYMDRLRGGSYVI